MHAVTHRCLASTARSRWRPGSQWWLQSRRRGACASCSSGTAAGHHTQVRLAGAWAKKAGMPFQDFEPRPRFDCHCCHCFSHLVEYQPDGRPPPSASAVPIGPSFEVFTPTGGGPFPYPTPRPLSLEEIPGVINQYVVAARNAMSAGFDGVEVRTLCACKTCSS